MFESKKRPSSVLSLFEATQRLPERLKTLKGWSNVWTHAKLGGVVTSFHEIIHALFLSQDQRLHYGGSIIEVETTCRSQTFTVTVSVGGGSAGLGWNRKRGVECCMRLGILVYMWAVPCACLVEQCLWESAIAQSGWYANKTASGEVQRVI